MLSDIIVPAVGQPTYPTLTGHERLSDGRTLMEVRTAEKAKLNDTCDQQLYKPDTSVLLITMPTNSR